MRTISDGFLIGDVIEEFTKLLEMEGKSRNTVSGYTRDVKTFFNYFGQYEYLGYPYDRTLRDVVPVLPDAILNYEEFVKEDSTISPQTSNRRIISLRRFLKFLYDNGVLEEDLSESIHVQKIQGGNTTGTKWISRNEVKAILNAIPKLHKSSEFSNVRNKAVIMVLVNCGLRVAELCDLKVPDVDLRKSLIIVRDGKGGKARKVPMGEATRDIVAKWLGYRMGASDVKSEYVFTTERSGQMTPRAVQHLTKSLSNITGIDFSPHTLRHTFCKNLADSGNSLTAVAELAGHADIGTTRIYTIPSMDELKGIVDDNEIKDDDTDKDE